MKSEILEQTEFKVSKEAISKSATNLIPSGNVIVATRVGLGKVCLLAQDTAINQDLKAIIPRDPKRLNIRFLFWWFRSVAKTIIEAGTGATVQGVKLPFIKSLEIPLPPLAEQKRTVAILDESFEGLAIAAANAEKNLKNARELFDSYLNAVFETKGDGWVEKSFSDICYIKHGFAFKSEYFAQKGKYVLLTPGNFYESGGYRDRAERQKYYVGEIPHGYVLSKGDLLVAMTEQAEGLLGSPILVPESGTFLHNQRLGLVSAKAPKSWLNQFFFYAFNLKRIRQLIHESASGVKVRHTSPQKIGDLKISFPSSIDAQRSISNQLFELELKMDELGQLYTQKLAALAELKQSLLAKAFSGQLTASVAA